MSKGRTAGYLVRHVARDMSLGPYRSLNFGDGKPPRRESFLKCLKIALATVWKMDPKESIAKAGR